jgi:hypothetical protein
VTAPAAVMVDPETLLEQPCARCGLPGAVPTAAGMLHQACFEQEREDAFAASPGFYVGGDLSVWFATSDVPRTPPRQANELSRPRREFKDPPVLAVLRDLVRDTSTSWPVSDLPGRVTLEGIWRGTCRDRLGMDGDAFDAARDALVKKGKVARDRPDLPPSIAVDDWRVRPFWRGAALSDHRPEPCRLDQRRLELLLERGQNPEVKVCLRCGGSTMFQRTGPGAQTAAWMCSRCDRPNRFAGVEHARDDNKRRCEICDAMAVVWGPGRAHARCDAHFDPDAPALNPLPRARAAGRLKP